MKLKIKGFALPLSAVAAVAVLACSPSATYAASQAPGVAVQFGWDKPPDDFRDVQRQGFHDGIEGARKDFDHHRMPDVNRREEYRHPHVDPSLRSDYREGYRRGYEAAMHHLMDQMPQ